MIETENILVNALSEALETMAFLDIFPIDENMVIPESSLIGTISFSGPENGTIEIMASLELCRVLAENIGAIENADDEAAFDALKELSNVTCGLVLPKIASSSSDVFDITVPQVKCDGILGWGEFTDQNGCLVSNVEGHAFAARMIVKD